MTLQGRLALAASTLAALAAITAGAAPAFAQTTARHTSVMADAGTQMATVKITSPTQGNTVPPDMYVVGVQITVPAQYAKDVTVHPAFVTPTSKYFKPGPNYYFPGLVVTDTGTTGKIGGPMKNIAGLFQMIGVRWNLAGSEVIDAEWLVGKPLFSTVKMPCLRAYVVKGAAPAVLPANPANTDIGTAFHGMTLLSNVAKIDFYTGAMSSAGSSSSTMGG